VPNSAKGGGVLQNKDAMATVAVKDIKAAAKFYEGTLGLKIIEGPEPSVRSYKAGSSTLLVYESQFARTNKATAVTWTLGADLEGIVRGLKDKGVTFEHYDLPETSRQGDIHVSGDTKVAWFKDPDGNIHSLINR
jgi:catechol 2,3-dioxygenase-like lactoylglutathione lyase family enzyme